MKVVGLINAVLDYVIVIRFSGNPLSRVTVINENPFFFIKLPYQKTRLGGVVN